MKKIAIICLIGVLGAFMFSSMKKTDDQDAKVKYMDLVRIPISLNISKMQGRIGCRDTVIPYADKLYKIIVFVDSTECYSCTLKDLNLWNDYVKDTIFYNKYINYYFIFSSKKNDISYIYSTIEKRGFPFPVLVDSANVFEKENPQIPHDPRFHVFLLDKENKIRLVGNPLKNKKISIMLKQMLDSVSIN